MECEKKLSQHKSLLRLLLVSLENDIPDVFDLTNIIDVLLDNIEMIELHYVKR